jgi:TorA maturation chaperone TorD
MTGWAEIARTRQGLYRFFGEALLPPSVEQLELLTGAATVLDGRDLDRFAFSRDFRRFCRTLPADGRADGIDVEYVRLFASGMSSALSPPTESYYCVASKGGEIAAFVAHLRREYRAMGVASVGLDEAPDHISTELYVMAHLCEMEAAAWEEQQTALAGDVIDTQAGFLRRHPAAWFPTFRDRVHAADPSDFYRELVDVTHAFVVHDHDYVWAVGTEVSR